MEPDDEVARFIMNEKISQYMTRSMTRVKGILESLLKISAEKTEIVIMIPWDLTLPYYMNVITDWCDEKGWQWKLTGDDDSVRRRRGLWVKFK